MKTLFRALFPLPEEMPMDDIEFLKMISAQLQAQIDKATAKK